MQCLRIEHNLVPFIIYSVTEKQLVTGRHPATHPNNSLVSVVRKSSLFIGHKEAVPVYKMSRFATMQNQIIFAPSLNNSKSPTPHNCFVQTTCCFEPPTSFPLHAMVARMLISSDTSVIRPGPAKFFFYVTFESCADVTLS